MQLDKDWRTAILTRMEYIKRTYGIAPSTQGRYAFNNGRLYGRLVEGQNISVDTYIRYMEWSDQLIEKNKLEEA